MLTGLFLTLWHTRWQGILSPWACQLRFPQTFQANPPSSSKQLHMTFPAAANGYMCCSWSSFRWLKVSHLKSGQVQWMLVCTQKMTIICMQKPIDHSGKLNLERPYRATVFFMNRILASNMNWKLQSLCTPVIESSPFSLGWLTQRLCRDPPWCTRLWVLMVNCSLREAHGYSIVAGSITAFCTSVIPLILYPLSLILHKCDTPICFIKYCFIHHPEGTPSGNWAVCMVMKKFAFIMPELLVFLFKYT